jgi:hypothetical protein
MSNQSESTLLEDGLSLEQIKGVKRTGTFEDIKEFEAFLKNPEICSRDILLSQIFKNYCGTTYGDEHWRKFDGGWTTPKTPTAY